MKILIRIGIVIVCCFTILASQVSAHKMNDRLATARSDIAPNRGPVLKPNSLDDPWDLLFETNAEVTTGDNQLLGGEFVNNHFYITGGNSAADPNLVYALNEDGTLAFQFDQWSSPGWGWRDLAYDGQYLYGSDDYVIDAFDPDGNPVPEMNITGPITPCRGLAYDPATDHFWTASFSSSLYEFDRDGNIIWSGPIGLSGVYGLAWDEMELCLWIHDQSGSPATTIYQFDPVNHFMTGFSYTVPLMSNLSDQMAGGLFFTNEWGQTHWTLGGVVQGTPEDMVYLLEMYYSTHEFAPAAPQNFTITPGAAGALNCTLTWDLPTTTVSGLPISQYPITSIELERDGVHIASLPPATVSFFDAVPASGMYQYSILCVNDWGNGIPAVAEAWIGLDTPGEVENLIAEPQGFILECLLTWDNPTAGAHGGYWPSNSIDGYIINRYGPITATFEITGITTQYLDTSIPIAGWYSYEISAFNSSGTGPEVPSQSLFIGYPNFEEVPYDWVEINPNRPGSLPGTNSGITLDDQNVGPFNLGFYFPFGSSVFSSIRLCSNGFASFTSTATTYSNSTIPDPEEPNNLIAPYWDDLNLSTTSGHGTIWYYSDPGNGRFIAQWDSVAHYGTTWEGDYFTFQLILQNDGSVYFMYKDIEPGTGTPFPQATVGIENGEGTSGVQVTYNGSGPWEPESQTGVIIWQLPPPPSWLTLTPESYSIGIPATGGSFDFNIAITNLSSIIETFDVWIKAYNWMYGWEGVVLGPATITLGSGITVERDRTQYVPAGAFPGEYTYTGYYGNFPDDIWGSDSFGFYKEYSGDGPVVSEWANTGDSFDIDPLEIDTEQPLTFQVQPAYPNPFNPTTTIGYTLPADEKVTLKIYDISGSLVASIIDGWRKSGHHEAIVDATGWASGIYLYHLEAGSHQAVGKLMLVK